MLVWGLQGQNRIKMLKLKQMSYLLLIFCVCLFIPLSRSLWSGAEVQA